MGQKTWRSWGTKDLERLAAMRGDGLTAPAIAAELGRTVPSVRNRLAQEGLSRPRRHRVLFFRWLSAFRAPHTIAGLAAAFGVKKRSVVRAKQRLRRLGYDVLPATWGGPARFDPPREARA